MIALYHSCILNWVCICKIHLNLKYGKVIITRTNEMRHLHIREIRCKKISLIFLILAVFEWKRNFSTSFCIDYETNKKNRNSHAIIIFLLRNLTNFNLKIWYRKEKTDRSWKFSELPIISKEQNISFERIQVSIRIKMNEFI